MFFVNIAFEDYCSRVAKAEGCLEELDQEVTGGDEWGPYRTQLFWRLYSRSAVFHHPDIARSRLKALWGVNMVFIVMTCFVIGLCFWIPSA
jgi:hypothetical protein